MGIGGPLGLFATFPVVCKSYLLAGDSLLIFMGLGGGRDYEIPEIGLGLPNIHARLIGSRSHFNKQI